MNTEMSVMTNENLYCHNCGTVIDQDGEIYPATLESQETKEGPVLCPDCAVDYYKDNGIDTCWECGAILDFEKDIYSTRGAGYGGPFVCEECHSTVNADNITIGELEKLSETHNIDCSVRYNENGCRVIKVRLKKTSAES